MFTKCLLLLCLFVNYSLQFSQLSSECTLPRLDHGRTRLRLRAKMAKFSCFPRYELVGNKYATCVDGRWDEQPPVCVRSGCEVPEVENGVVLRMRQDAWLVFFCMPGHKLVGSLAIYCDGRKWNTTAPMCVDESAPPELSCDFETVALCGWTNDILHDFDWRRLSKKTPSSFLNTGPSFDHTLGKGKLGYYMYIESTSRNENETARLLSPIYNGTLAKNGCFSFFYHMYGLSIGGLRVYQKPESLALPSLLSLSTVDKQKYILFEKWYNQGDFWYQSVTMLTDWREDFQIVIEGIRGHSFTSDIAIDDVAILQADNCTAAAQFATTPTAFSTESCMDRCDHINYEHFAFKTACGCTDSCVQSYDCCPDYFELCVFTNDATTTERSMDEFPSNYSQSLEPIDTKPQTQKLVGTTPQTTTQTLTESTTTSTTAKTTVTTTKSTSTTTSTTTRTPETTTTLKPTKKILPPTFKLTTRKPKFNPRLIFKTTTAIYNATGLLNKDTTKTVVKTTTEKPDTTVKTTKTAVTMSTVKTTTLNHGVSRTYENHNRYHELIEKAKKDKLNSEKVKNDGNEAEKGTGGSRTVITLSLLVLCACVVLVALGSRTARGRAVVARIRGRATHDPEVRYLTGHSDD